MPKSIINSSDIGPALTALDIDKSRLLPECETASQVVLRKYGLTFSEPRAGEIIDRMAVALHAIDKSHIRGLMIAKPLSVLAVVKSEFGIFSGMSRLPNVAMNNPDHPLFVKEITDIKASEMPGRNKIGMFGAIAAEEISVFQQLLIGTNRFAKYLGNNPVPEVLPHAAASNTALSGGVAIGTEFGTAADALLDIIELYRYNLDARNELVQVRNRYKAEDLES